MMTDFSSLVRQPVAAMHEYSEGWRFCPCDSCSTRRQNAAAVRDPARYIRRMLAADIGMAGDAFRPMLASDIGLSE